MAYEHTFVSSLTDVPEDRCDIDVERDDYYMDGVRVPPKLREFALEVRSTVLPGCRFGAKYSGYDNTLYVYYPGELYTRGRISYRAVDTMTSNGRRKANFGAPTFNVVSRLICNSRSHHASEKRITVSAKDVSRACKAAGKHLKKYTDEEIIPLAANVFYKHINSSLYKYRKEGRDKFAELSSRLEFGGNTELYTQLIYFLNGATEFTVPGIKEKLLEAKAAAEMFSEMSRRGVSGTLAYLNEGKVSIVRSQAATQTLGTVNEVTFAAGFTTGGGFTRCALEDIPEDLQMQIATLNIVEVGTFVEDVGVQIVPNIFGILGI